MIITTLLYVMIMCVGVRCKEVLKYITYFTNITGKHKFACREMEDSSKFDVFMGVRGWGDCGGGGGVQ